MPKDTRFDTINNRLHVMDRKFRDSEVALKKLQKAIKAANTLISQMSYRVEKMDEILKTVIVVTSVLQTRTGGKLNDQEIAREKAELKYKFEASKQTPK